MTELEQRMEALEQVFRTKDASTQLTEIRIEVEKLKLMVNGGPGKTSWCTEHRAVAEEARDLAYKNRNSIKGMIAGLSVLIVVMNLTASVFAPTIRSILSGHSQQVIQTK